MKNNSLIIFLVFSLSCTTLTQTENECGNNSIFILAGTIDSGLKNIILRNVNHADSVFLQETLFTLMKLNTIEETLVAHAGGISPETKNLLYGCKTVSNSELENIKVEIDSIETELNRMKTQYSGAREQEVLEIIVDAINKHALSEAISNKSYSEITLHILVLHNLVYTKILDLYIFP